MTQVLDEQESVEWEKLFDEQKSLGTLALSDGFKKPEALVVVMNGPRIIPLITACWRRRVPMVDGEEDGPVKHVPGWCRTLGLRIVRSIWSFSFGRHVDVDSLGCLNLRVGIYGRDSWTK